MFPFSSIDFNIDIRNYKIYFVYINLLSHVGVWIKRFLLVNFKKKKCPKFLADKKVNTYFSKRFSLSARVAAFEMVFKPLR